MNQLHGTKRNIGEAKPGVDSDAQMRAAFQDWWGEAAPEVWLGMTPEEKVSLWAWNALPKAWPYELANMAWKAATLFAAGWRPIETAPKDGSDIWLYLPDDEPSQAVGYFDGTDPANRFWAYREALVLDVQGAANPTHWMPLPAKPEG